MCPEIVNRKFNWFARIQLFQMIDQQLVIDRVRMIKVCRVTIIERHVHQIAVVQILLDKNNLVSPDRFEYPIRYRRLA